MKIVIVSSWLPRECGIATFSRDVANSLKKYCKKEIKISVCALQEPKSEKRKYGPEVKWKIRDWKTDDYIKAAKEINKSNVDIVFLSHEFGLFGPKEGKNILLFIDNLKKPLISNFHTIPVLPGSNRRKDRIALLKKISEKSRFVIVTSHNARNELVDKFGFENKKIQVIYHGSPDIPFLSHKKKEEQRKKMGIGKNSIVIISSGMIRESKGFEYGINAMTRIVKDFPGIILLIIGAAHPTKIANWRYYQKLKWLVKNKKLENHVKFLDYYLPDKDLINYFAISDMILLPYLAKEQVSSGILAWAIAAGKIVISTPFYYAEEILKKRGSFINFRSAASIEKNIENVLNHPKKALLLSRRARIFGLSTNWKKTVNKYWRLFKQAKN